MTDCLFTMLSTLSASSNPGPLLSGGDVQFSNSEVDASSTVWVGSAFLFIQCTSDKIDLSCCYQNAMQKPKVFSALRLVLTGSSVGGVNAICILKVYCSDHQLIVYLKFNDQEICQRFLQNYRNGLLQREMQSQLQVALSLIEVPLLMELKVGNEKLDGILDDEERCLQYINKEKPDRLPDEEIAELEESLKSLNCQPEKSTENPQMKKHSLPHEPKRSLSSESYEQLRVTFVFQNQEFGISSPFATAICMPLLQMGFTPDTCCFVLISGAALRSYGTIANGPHALTQYWWLGATFLPFSWTSASPLGRPCGCVRFHVAFSYVNVALCTMREQGVTQVVAGHFLRMQHTMVKSVLEFMA
ncbi:tumor necrosis factor receptor type 1-associated DEATH domain protein isoform X1 [Ambystoma mexicanum]|uniref:tumor necrosis factor receptor type 1-associated DEATH domain protein isoform X1 n=1 Tax=Ambystoma mexicanum TaxID=8296 RepID=UPI0037E7E7F2